ncbi:MAG: hypothetical protein JNN04_11115 [Cyclobacteriaceae bacterium]|nr:hypothetical protein [Cyclobacteriaceae bacterium]
MKSFWLSVGLLASGIVHAQDYLVTTRKDTLRGKLSISGYNTSDRLVLTVDKKKTEYQAYTVLVARIDTNTFIPVRVPDAFRFMRLHKSGMVNLCYARQAPGTPFNIPYLVKVSGESLEVNALRFKKTVSRFLAECANVRQKIEEDSLGRNDLEKIVDAYNQCLVQQTTVAFTSTDDPKLAALTAFNNKLGSDSTVPQEALDILRDLYTKIKEGKPAPNYLTEGLREALKAHPAYQEDLQTLLDKLKK